MKRAIGWAAAFCATLALGGAGAGADGVYSDDVAEAYQERCADSGADKRICACAAQHIRNERGKLPAVSAGTSPSMLEIRKRSARYAGYQASCERAAGALGMLEP